LSLSSLSSLSSLLPDKKQWTTANGQPGTGRHKGHQGHQGHKGQADDGYSPLPVNEYEK